MLANIKNEISTCEDINIGRGNKHDYVYPLLSGVLTTYSFFSFYKWVNKGCKKVCNSSKFILLEWGRAMSE